MTAARKEFAGAAAATTLTSSMTAGAPTAGQTFTVASGANYPTGAYSGGFVIVVDAGSASEEKILCSARSGNTFTVATSGRAWDGTTAVSHGGGVTTGTVVHCIDGDTMTDISAHVYDTTRDDHTQYQKSNLLTTQADIPYATAASTWARLPKGTALQALLMNAGATAPSWAASLQSLFSAKGSLAVASAANTPAELAIGSDFQFLRGRAAATNGVEYATLGSAATTNTAEATASTTYADLATVGPAVGPITTGTSVLIAASASIYSSVIGDGGAFSVAVSGATTRAAADDQLSATLIASVAGATEQRVGVVAIVTGLTAGSNTFTMKYRARVGGSAGFLTRHLVVIPI